MSWRAPQELSSPLSSVPPSASPSPSPPASESEMSDISDSELSRLELEHTLASRRAVYPSPSASNRSSAKASPAPESMASPPSSNDDDDRPRKKRKLTDPKERSTGRLDLRRDLTDADKPQLDRLLKTLHKKRKIVVIAGAGISTSADIPDFRSSTGLFKSLRKEHKRISSGKDLFDASVYQDDSSTSSFHDMVRNLSQKTKKAEPTAFHHLLATLANEGRLLRLYTQNVDGIDTKLKPLETKVPLPKKNPWPKTVQLHGGLDYMVCSKCHDLKDFDAEMFSGPVPPACPNCLENDSVRGAVGKRSHGIGRLRPRMVLYNEHNPDDEAIGSCVSSDLRTRPDAVIVAGTTLKVPGVRRITREMCATVRDRRDGMTIWINNDPEPISGELANIWDLVIQGPCDEVARHAAMPRWDDPVVCKEVTEDELSKIKEKQTAEVRVPKTPRKLSRHQGHLPTPGQSPRMGPLRIKEEPTEQQNPPTGSLMVKREPKEQPSTPSNKSLKRKTQDAPQNAFDKLASKPTTKAKRAQAQPRKVGSVKSKAKAVQHTKPSRPITVHYKATKNSRLVPGTKTTGKPVETSNFIAYKPSVSSAVSSDRPDVTCVSQKQPMVAASKKVLLTHKTQWKGQVPFTLIASSDARYNHSPQSPPRSPTVESLTPVKPRSPSQQILDEQEQRSLQVSPRSPSRPPSSSARITVQNLLNPVA